MARNVLVDAGFLVALLSRRDSHQRMTETLPDPVILTTDSDFRIYRRHSRQMVPCMMPS
jgi:hypothetical protein